MNGAESLVRTLVAGGVDVCFTNPGTSEMHFVAALDRVEGMRCVLGLFEGVVTGRRRRLLPHEGHAGFDPAASRARPRQRPCQPAQRQEGELRHRQHRRPARDLPYRLQRPADVGHRGAGAADVGLGADLAGCEVGRRRRRRRDRGSQERAAADRDPDPAGRYRLERGRRHRAGPGGKPARQLFLAGRGQRRQGAAQRRRIDAAADDRQRAHRARAGAGRPDRGQDRLQGDGPDLQSADGARQGPLLDRPHSLRDRAGAADPEGLQEHRAGRGQRSRGVLRLSEQAEHAQAAGLRGASHDFGCGKFRGRAGGAGRCAAAPRRPTGSRRRWWKSPSRPAR